MRNLSEFQGSASLQGLPMLLPCRGVVLRGQADDLRPTEALQLILARLGLSDLMHHVLCATGFDAQGHWLRLSLKPERMAVWAPGYNTMDLATQVGLNPQHNLGDLHREILIALLMHPDQQEFPSLDELESALRIRANIVHAARRTTLAFDTEAAERPEDCWDYQEDRGFILRPGVNLIDALIKTTQPKASDRLYAFSCYRATEYVILLGIAQELACSNPVLLEQLQTFWQQRAIKSGEFHEVFLSEQGSLDDPLPPLYYVPGDRVWFRNPDGASAEACGFEGSWVMYLGSGQFTNFWKYQQPYTLTEKCVEIYHWRHGLHRDAQGEARIDEERIKPLIAQTLAHPQELARVMACMTRWREPRGVYTEAGGCMDTSREFARWIRPATADLHLPPA
jgi:hypothetical protein